MMRYPPPCCSRFDSLVALIAMVCPTAVADDSAEPAVAISNGAVQVRFVGVADKGYRVEFDSLVDGSWTRMAEYVNGGCWGVFCGWKDSWYADGQRIPVRHVERISDSQARATSEAVIAGHTWKFTDDYSFEAGLIKIERTWEHLSAEPQRTITLETRIRFALGDDPRTLIPGSIYNGNPSSTLPGPRLTLAPDAIALYEEHRLPIPMVNVESTVAGSRHYGTLLSVPARIAQGQKGDDHWWSLGLEAGEEYVDLLSVSGAVATNGMKSTIYGHRNGFDKYDEAYLDVDGVQQYHKTLYLDLGCDGRLGETFRLALWKAFDVFRPVDVPHVEFNAAMALKVDFAKGSFYREAPDVAGFCAWPWPNRHFQYGWCGGNIAIAYGLLAHAQRTGDQQSLRQAIDAIDFYARHSQQQVPGMFYGDYFATPAVLSRAAVREKGGGWQPTPFHGLEPAISSRQLGETLERLAEATMLGRRMGLEAEATLWQDAVRRGCDFLVQSPRYRGMFPRAWNTDGSARGWQGDQPQDAGWLSTAGLYCVGPLVRMHRLSGEERYLTLAQEVLTGYWQQFGAEQATPPWGGTHDAGAEDKEAGWGMMKAALDVYESTQNRQYLEWAQWAADWTLTWMYFHDVGMPSSEVLDKTMKTVGWTFISTQNQEIDVFGFWMAPDYYRLGRMLGDERYCQIGKVLFDASTQTIAREDYMMGQVVRGIQAEHYNHSNCTYVPDGPWRGSQHSMGIGWVLASTLYGGAKLAELDPATFDWLDQPDRRVVVPTAQRQRNEWRYTFQRPADEWFVNDFDDSHWPSGPGGFGEYGTPGTAIGTWWDVQYPRIWIRRVFELGSDLPHEPMLLVHHDDAAQIYVNGVLAAELSGYQTCYTIVPMRPEAVAALRSGENVLAATCEDLAGGRHIDVGLIEAARPVYEAVCRPIVVDGRLDDWQDIAVADVSGAEHLWFGQGMTPQKWQGNRDLSYRWRSAWFDNRLYFLFEVTDETVLDVPSQPNSFLNDCIEILLDPQDRGGRRFLEDGAQKVLRGYEMHFLPGSTPLVFVDDRLSPLYPLDKPQNELFISQWRGEVKVTRTSSGYVMEIGFAVPGVQLDKGMQLGIDTDVCDDDGQGRESLLLWTGRQVDFWITMDHYGHLRLVD